MPAYMQAGPHTALMCALLPPSFLFLAQAAVVLLVQNMHMYCALALLACPVLEGEWVAPGPVPVQAMPEQTLQWLGAAVDLIPDEAATAADRAQLLTLARAAAQQAPGSRRCGDTQCIACPCWHTPCEDALTASPSRSVRGFPWRQLWLMQAESWVQRCVNSEWCMCAHGMLVPTPEQAAGGRHGGAVGADTPQPTLAGRGAVSAAARSAILVRAQIQ